MAPTHSIVFENVHRRFDQRMVLRGLDLAVRPGEIHALLGRNGSGKTTAMRILLGFLEPHAGRTTVLGTDSRVLGAEHRGLIGYVGEDHRLYWHMRARDVIAFEEALEKVRAAASVDHTTSAILLSKLISRHAG